jgi:hypothetical protein
VNVRELRTALKKLDAIEDRSGHHIYFYLEIDNHDYRVSKLSHSMRSELPPFVAKDTTRRLNLTSSEFKDLVDCQIKKTDFLRLWKLRNP